MNPIHSRCRVRHSRPFAARAQGILFVMYSSRSMTRFLLLAVLVGGAATPFAAPVAFANSGPSDAEAHALDLINAERAKLGRAALQWDARVADIAQYRSDVQASKNEMFHDMDAIL